MDKSTGSQLPESLRHCIFQTSERGLAPSRQRPKGRRRRGDFGTGSTRRRMPRGRGTRRGERQDLSWSDPDPEPLKPRGRKVGKAGISGPCRGSAKPSGDAEPFEVRVERSVSEPPGDRGGPRDQTQPPTEPAPARAPGDERPISAWLFGAGTETALKRRASSFLLRQEPHAGESGVSRKAGPISLWG